MGRGSCQLVALMLGGHDGVSLQLILQEFWPGRSNIQMSRATGCASLHLAASDERAPAPRPGERASNANEQRLRIGIAQVRNLKDFLAFLVNRQPISIRLGPSIPGKSIVVGMSRALSVALRWRDRASRRYCTLRTATVSGAKLLPRTSRILWRIVNTSTPTRMPSIRSPCPAAHDEGPILLGPREFQVHGALGLKIAAASCLRGEWMRMCIRSADCR